jgi:hypothetical protein
MSEILVSQEYETLLSDAGLDNFDAIWTYPGGRSIKEIKARSVVCIELPHQGRNRSFYLKRHNQENLGIKRLLALFLPRVAISQGLQEFNNISEFRRHFIATATPVAAGERHVGLFEVDSFLLTEDFYPYVTLEILLEEPHFLCQMADRSKRRALLGKIALTARKMHQSGLNHCDFNTNHIIVHYEGGSDTPKIALYDLQRIYKRNYFKFRWVVKSLAELCYTLPDALFDEADKIFLFRSYKEKDKLNPWDRLQWFWIKKKVERIRRHTKKIIAKRATHTI